MNDFAAWAAAVAQRTKTALEQALPQGRPSERLHQAMRYAALGGGKRMRQLLAHAAGELAGADPAAVDAAACALEMIHAYSLVHDDLPCMDDDDLRRGRPTAHKAFDEATALLAGDALQPLAFALLSADALALPDAVKLALVRELAQASGSLGMAGGQAIDLESVGKRISLDALEAMHRLKTGALLRAALRMGLLCGAGKTLLGADALDAYGAAVGLAFQVVDDVLDATTSTEVLGKTAGKDGADNKPTYVTLLGLEAAQALAEDLRRQAHAALDALRDAGDVSRLRSLADKIVMRGN
ncbi:MAG: polyprenyl synthetase family protein [Candidatus Protistobacter heckmanni]|nr:polyprenyl synthetase family protein [Candidatus Protistobacter heckmanni]